MNRNRIWISTAALLLGQNLFGAGAIWEFATEEQVQQIDASDKVTVIDFGEFLTADISTSGDITELKTVSVPADMVVKVGGNTALEVISEDNLDGKQTRLTLNLSLEEKIDTSMCRALVFYYYVSEEYSSHFLGRFDLMVHMDDINFAEPAIRPGWNQFVMDFETLPPVPSSFSSLRIVVGDIMEGYETGRVLIGPVRLVKCPPLGESEDLKSVVKGDKSWAKRYAALQLLSKKASIDLLEAVMAATADSAMVIRNTAIDVMADMTQQIGARSLDAIKKGMASEQWRTRDATIRLIAKVKELFPEYAEKAFWNGLLDDCFYVRDFSLGQLLENGTTKAQVARVVAEKLDDGDGAQSAATIRMLREIGPQAVGTLPPLLAILRDPYEQTEMRCEALAAVWWIDEEPLKPEDWILGLSLNPDNVHLHLLNKSMERLVAGKGDSVNALLDVLKARNPLVQARALACLRQIGPDAKASVRKLEMLSKSKKWYLTYQAAVALQAITGRDGPVEVMPPIQHVESKLSVVDDGENITVGNGIVEMVFEHGNDEGGPRVIRRIGGDNLVDGDWLYKTLAFRHSKGKNILERRYTQKLFGSPIPKDQEDVVQEVFYQDERIIDLMVKYSEPGCNVEYEFHYVLEKGKSGYYSYVVTRNMTGEEMEDRTAYSETGIGRLNQLTALTWGAYDYGFCSDNLKRPAYFTPDVVTCYSENYPDIYQCTFRLPDGTVAAKHEWHISEQESDVIGFAGLKEGGFWMIIPSQESKATALPRRKAGGINNNLFLNGITGKYYIESKMVIPSDWEKVSGPFFFYINDGENIEEMWVDAQRQAREEKELFPYNWLTAFNFQDRGTVRGQVKIAGDESAEGTYVVLSNPIDKGDPYELTTWMRNAGPYIYWTEAEADGSFEIRDVRSDEYGVYAFKPGVYGLTEAEKKVKVQKGKIAKTEDLVIEPESAGKLIWQIGIPDGGATEFRNGNNYHVWENYTRYQENFPNGVHYTVGESDWSRDWNYIHPACFYGGGEPTTWTIDFDLDELPEQKALLSIACSGRGAEAYVMLNGEKIGDLNVSYMGVQHVRTHPYGEIVLRKYEIDRTKLQTGTNTIELTFSQEKSEGEPIAGHFLRKPSNWLSYDFIRLENVQ